jgi:hypothetical protein
MITEEDVKRAGFTSIDLLTEEMTMVFFLSDRAYDRHLAGTILHLLDKFPWDKVEDDTENLQFQGPTE